MVSRETVDNIRKVYTKGSRVQLLKMEDKQAPPIGTLGTVQCVDDIGTIHVAWDSGSCLGVCLEVDSCIKVD